MPVLSATLYIDPSTGATRVGRVDVAAACKMIDGMAIFLNGQHTEFLEPLYTYFLTTVLTQKSSKEESAVPPDVLSFYVTSLARYALVAQQKFLGLFTKINGLDAAQAFETFLAVWTVKVMYIYVHITRDDGLMMGVRSRQSCVMTIWSE